mmetsp:Transcript_20472/g.39727  ORF Transcript_20472/g.39727 Transcript_20472/m.39727 type:complete len:265 (-) Transcript_20472:187-981(-)
MAWEGLLALLPPGCRFWGQVVGTEHVLPKPMLSRLWLGRLLARSKVDAPDQHASSGAPASPAWWWWPGGGLLKSCFAEPTLRILSIFSCRWKDPLSSISAEMASYTVWERVTRTEDERRNVELLMRQTGVEFRGSSSVSDTAMPASLSARVIESLRLGAMTDMSKDWALQMAARPFRRGMLDPDRGDLKGDRDLRVGDFERDLRGDLAGERIPNLRRLSLPLIIVSICSSFTPMSPRVASWSCTCPRKSIAPSWGSCKWLEASK